MTTFTYDDPLVGLSSVTDAADVTTYREYDGLGRLKGVKDHNGHLTRQHVYHYRGQTP